MRKFTIVLCVLFVFIFSSVIHAQDNLSLIRVSYNTAKTQNPPEGALKSTLEELEKEAVQAVSENDLAKAEFLYQKGTFLVRGGNWTKEKAFEYSIKVTPERYYIDPINSTKLLFSQKTEPDLKLGGQAKVVISLFKRTGRNEEKMNFSQSDVDLPPVFTDEPSDITLSFANFVNGYFELRSVFIDSDGNEITRKSVFLTLIPGLDSKITKLENLISRADKMWIGKREDLIDLLPTANYTLQLLDKAPDRRPININDKMENTLDLLESILEGRNPVKGRSGNFQLAYVFPETGELLPYRVFVPSDYDDNKQYPVIVALHGLGADESSFFTSYGGRLIELAEEHGYIVVGPLGYRKDGFYGVSFGSRPKPYDGYGQNDVFYVIDRVLKDYNVDQDRMYLMGHSMGGYGSWYLASEKPEMFAAIAPIAGGGSPLILNNILHVPEIVVHGDADPTVSVESSRQMVETAKRLGIEVEYYEIKGGNHMNIVVPYLDEIVEFFNNHKRAVRK
ncbi:alpha/beta fold hydrolase [candidate division KSB1 bacterium]